MIQQGQLFKLKARSAEGEPLWAYRYRAAGRGSARRQVGGFASRAEAQRALQNRLARLAPGGRSATITLGEWVAERTVDEVLALLGPDGADVPCSPVYGPADLLAHPQLLAREMLQRLPHPRIGEVVVPGVVPKLSATPGTVRRLGPELGEHNAEVYGELLGLGAAELERLRAAQVI